MSYLSYPTNVLISALLVKAKVLVESESYVVAVKTVGGEAEMKEVLFERGRNGGFSGCAETSKPDREAALLPECVALAAREGWVPGNVTAIRISIQNWLTCSRTWRPHVAIVERAVSN